MLENTQSNNVEEQNTIEVEDVQEVKTFTQEEVNKIVENRLARERKKLGAMFNDPRESELSKKESEMSLKETKLDMREYLLENNKNLNLLKFIDLSKGKEQALKSYEELEECFNAEIEKEISKRLRGAATLKKAPQAESIDDEATRKAFKL